MDPKDRFDVQAFFWKTKRLPKKDKLRVEVNLVINPHKLYFNIIDESYEEIFMPLMKKLQTQYRGDNLSDVIPKSKLRIGLPCVIRHQNVYFRGIIVSKTSEYVKVRTVDYGEDVTITRTEYNSRPLFWLNRELAKTPILAIAGALKFLEPKGHTWTREASDMLMDHLENREVNAIIIDQGCPGGTVDLCLECPETGENIEMELVKAGLAIFVDEKNPEVEPIDSPPAKREKVDEEDAAINQVIKAVDLSSSESSNSDDELNISVRVYSTEGSEAECHSPLCDVEDAVETVEPDGEPEVEANSRQDSKEEQCSEDGYRGDENYSYDEEDEYDAYEGEDDEEEDPAISCHPDNDRQTKRLTAPSEAMTSVSMVGRLSNVNLSAIKDSCEREKVKQEIVLEMQSLQQRLAELNCIVSSDEEDTGASGRLSPSAPEFVPKDGQDASSHSSSGLRPDAVAFVPQSAARKPRKDSDLRIDAEEFTPRSPVKYCDDTTEEEAEHMENNLSTTQNIHNIQTHITPKSVRHSDFGVSQPYSHLQAQGVNLYQSQTQMQFPPQSHLYPTQAPPGFPTLQPSPQFPGQPGPYVSSSTSKPKATNQSYNTLQQQHYGQTPPVFVSRRESWVYKDVHSPTPLMSMAWGQNIQQPPQVVGSHRRDTILCYQPMYGWPQ